MTRIHHIAGLVITAFVLIHLFNHLCSLTGVDNHIKVMQALRPFYRNLVAEAILLFAVLVQITSGAKLLVKKRKNATSFFDKLQVWSGFYLLFFFVFHIGAVLMGRWILNLDTNIYFGAAGLNTFPYVLFFLPYYGLAILSFFGHIAAIHSLKMKNDLLGINPIKQAYLIFILGIILSLLILYGLTNGFNGIEIPREYNTIYS